MNVLIIDNKNLISLIINNSRNPVPVVWCVELKFDMETLNIAIFSK